MSDHEEETHLFPALEMTEAQPPAQQPIENTPIMQELAQGMRAMQEMLLQFMQAQATAAANNQVGPVQQSQQPCRVPPASSSNQAQPSESAQDYRQQPSQPFAMGHPPQYLPATTRPP